MKTLGDGILRAHLKVKGNADDLAEVTEEEIQSMTQWKVRKSNALRKGEAPPETPSNVSERSMRFIESVEAGRKVMPGTNEHSLRMRTQLYSMRAMYGSQQIYFTISPDDLKLVSVLHYAGASADQIQNMDAAQRQYFAANNPVAAARHFHDLLYIIIKHLLCFDVDTERPIPNKAGPFGEILSFFIRIEEQKRGALHAHMLFSVRGLPATAIDMLKAWKNPTQAKAVQKYIDMVQWQSTLLPKERLVCPNCNEPDLEQPPFPTEVVEMRRVGKADMPEPELLTCTSCEQKCAPSEIVKNWIADTLGINKDDVMDCCMDEQILFEIISDLTQIDGAGPEEGVPLMEVLLAKMASRVLKVNWHSPRHTWSCFKNREQCR